jgi:hypothetical protein
MPKGHPRKWKSPQELQEKIEGYYQHCDEKDKPLTIAGLALWLDCDRKTLWNYGEQEDYFPIIKRARDHVITSLEERIAKEGKAGQIFLAKNYGYTDTQQINATITKNPLENLSPAELRKIIDDETGNSG